MRLQLVVVVGATTSIRRVDSIRHMLMWGSAHSKPRSCYLLRSMPSRSLI